MQIGRKMAPTFVGLSIMQINTFVNNLIALGLSAAQDGPQTISWLGGAVRYPLQQGAVAALYYGDRLCDFPLGTVGLPVAVAMLVDRSAGAMRFDVPAVSLLELSFPTYPADAVPDWLATIPGH